MEEEFELEDDMFCHGTPVSLHLKNANDNANFYLKELSMASNLHIMQETQVQCAYQSRGELSLFQMFITRQYIQVLTSCTNHRMKTKCKKTITEPQMKAYIGLELAMLLIYCSEISKYWSKSMFCGSKDFSHVMSHDVFTMIRAQLTF